MVGSAGVEVRTVSVGVLFFSAVATTIDVMDVVATGVVVCRAEGVVD